MLDGDPMFESLSDDELQKLHEMFRELIVRSIPSAPAHALRPLFACVNEVDVHLERRGLVARATFGRR